MSEGDNDNRLLARIPGTLAYKKRQMTWFAMLISSLSGAIAGLSIWEEWQSELYIVGCVLLLFAILRWCILDCQERGQRLGRWMMLAICLIMIVGVPIHLLRTRGMLRGLAACVAFAGLFCLLLGLEWGFETLVIAITEWRQGG